jgi:hypothetical protein
MMSLASLNLASPAPSAALKHLFCKLATSLHSICACLHLTHRAARQLIIFLWNLYGTRPTLVLVNQNKLPPSACRRLSGFKWWLLKRLRCPVSTSSEGFLSKLCSNSKLKRFRADVEIDFRQISEECYGAVEKKLKS